MCWQTKKLNSTFDMNTGGLSTLLKINLAIQVDGQNSIQIWIVVEHLLQE